MPYTLEVCVDSTASALAAKRGGADRLELCADLIIGGTTPSLALVRQVKAETGLPVRALLRPRFGDFCYDRYELAQMAETAAALVQAGADGIVVINPYYWKVSEANLIRYFEQVADSVTLPVMLYNFPALTGQDLTPALVKTLADSRSNIVGIKDTIDSVAHLRSMIHTVKAAHPHFTVLCGYDDHLFNTLLLGGDGAISASGNFAPQVSVNLLKAWRDKDVAKAAEYHQTLLQIPQMYQLDTPFVNVIKEAIVLCGRPISTHVLPPASPLDEPRKAQLKTLLQQLKLC